MSTSDDVELGLRALLRAYEQLEAACRRELGVGSNELLVLNLLADGVRAPTELSRVVGMTTAGMTNLLDRMETDEFLRRERHERDGRRVIVSLTKRGLQAHLRFAQITAEVARIPDGDGSTPAIVSFLTRAAETVERRATEISLSAS